MTQEQEEALSAIEAINDKFNETQNPEDGSFFPPTLTMTIMNSYTLISLLLFLGDGEELELPIYSSENDDRNFCEDENSGHYESFNEFLHRKLKETEKQLHDIRLT